MERDGETDPISTDVTGFPLITHSAARGFQHLRALATLRFTSKGSKQVNRVWRMLFTGGLASRGTQGREDVYYET